LRRRHNKDKAGACRKLSGSSINSRRTFVANHKSALKRIRSSEKRRQRNRVTRGTARSAVKRARVSLGGKDMAAAEVAVGGAVSALDKAAAKGVIHKNNAARRKSRLMRQLNQAKQPTA
jgi:small subunit ribosomal protein S20